MKALKITLVTLILVLATHGTSFAIEHPERPQHPQTNSNNSITTGDSNAQTGVVNNVNRTEIKLCNGNCPTPTQPAPTNPPGGGGSGGPGDGGSSGGSGGSSAPAEVKALAKTGSSDSAQKEAVLLLGSLLILAAGAKLALRNA